ncbi:hypothetical protein GCM10010168_37960 [Actinoplanes ianthinogenes]|uniref:Uncharacterized protein n=1 Tax=Actinoplanes ianthinogenes TaxID=122358 RepID=A0ABN6CR73_9ACTN|nr:hypothetical protein [Actinoplanes ianthinogenes]BCJ46682.1 hypothetical protein Aiant_73390 [Actinoplanes ianthinogenes]GGR16391.1 hypothetical protein GCM10010168_37960 [Actinoplanes ianthinogenes]
MSDRPRIDLDILRTITDCLRRANETARRVAGPPLPRPSFTGGEPATPLARRIRRPR